MKQQFNNLTNQSQVTCNLTNKDETIDHFIEYHNELNVYLNNQYNVLQIRQDSILAILRNNKDEITLRAKLEEPCYILWKYKFGVELIKRIQRLISRYITLISTDLNRFNRTNPNRKEEYVYQLDNWLYVLNSEVDAYVKLFNYPIPKFVSSY